MLLIILPTFVFAMCLFRSKTDINESLGGSLEMCSAGVVVSQLQCIPFVRQTHRTSWLREAPSQHQEVPLQRTIEKLVELVESYLASSSCKLWHTKSRSNFLVNKVHRLVCVYPSQLQRFHARISALLHWSNHVDTFRMYPVNLFTSRSQHKILGQIPTVDVVPEFFLLSRSDSIQQGFLVQVVQSLSTECSWSFSLSCSRSAFRIVAINVGGYVFNNVVCISGFIQFFSQTSCACSSK